MEGVNAVERMIKEHADCVSTPDEVKEFVEYSLGDGDEAVPFHWRVWSDGKLKKVRNSSKRTLNETDTDIT